MLRDLYSALRSMQQQRVAHGVVLLVLATALAAASAIFSLVDAALLRPLPYPQPRGLVEIRERSIDAAAGSNRLLAADFVELAASSAAIPEIAAILSTGMPITSLAEPLNPLMRRASANYFQMLRVEPLLGRAFSAREDRPGGAPVTILSHELWQGRLGGDPGILGQTLGLDGKPHEIIGVLPPGFRDPRFTGRPALWLPLALTPEELDRQARRPLRLTAVFGRLADGVSLDQAKAEIESLGVELEQRHPNHAGRITTARSLYEVVVEGYRPALLMLFGAVLFLLAVAFSNVVHLLLARALGRRRELGLRLALGASRRQLARQFVAESLVLALGGLGLGLLLAAAGLEPLLALMPDGLGVPRLESVQVGSRTIGFGLVLASVFGLGFGLVLMSQTPRLDRDGGWMVRSSPERSGRAGRRLRQLLIVVQIALSLTLLASAGWLTLSFLHLVRVAPGFEPEGVYTLRTSARGAEFARRERWGDFYQQVFESWRSLPGVEAVGGVSRLSISRPWRGSAVALPGREVVAGSEPRAMVFTVTPDYFEAMGMSLLGGREFSRADHDQAAQVVILSREAARRFFADDAQAGVDPARAGVGQTVVVDVDEGLSRRVVGVVADVRHGEPPGEARPTVYLPHAQNPVPTLSLVLRTSLSDPSQLAADLQRRIWRVSRDAPIYDLSTLSDLLLAVDWQPRFFMRLLLGFAVLSLLLAASGLYAVLSYIVAGDVRDIGIRLALGARRSQIQRQVIQQALTLAALGMLLGLPLTVAAGRLLQSQLAGVSTMDPWVLGGVALVVGVVTWLASDLPARRASRIDPAVVLRES